MERKTKVSSDGFEQIPFRMHPRVFAALGGDLVTNDVVAVIELVKNSYDAFSSNVWIRFREHPTKGPYLEILDDGVGMSRDIIEDVWCLVATPFKKNNPQSKSGKKVRRVSGEKGLGRFSVSRLGETLYMLTQEKGEPCWEVMVNWSEIAIGDDLTSSFIKFRKYSNPSPFRGSGTCLQIYGLKEQWDEARISDLEDNLARLLSPFSKIDDFSIYLSESEDKESEELKIEAPKFLAKPKYVIKGNVDKLGNITGKYRFSSLTEEKTRESEVFLPWEQVNDSIQNRTQRRFSNKNPQCGSFSFEIRAWDIDADGFAEISRKFSLQKSQIRKTIRAHKGISIYRDNILVLPKSEKARDWLGLDLRRVSKVGLRMSTNQLVGYVSISAGENPGIADTSDRERLVSSPAVEEFEEILITVVSVLENERDQDHVKMEKEKPIEDLFESLSTQDLLSEVEDLAKEGAKASEALKLLKDFSISLDKTSASIQKRFIYYSRMATIGTIAQMLVHEIRNKTTAFGNFLDMIKTRIGSFKENAGELEKAHRLAKNAVNALERLADTFAPLASRTFRRRKKLSILEDQINECLTLLQGELKTKQIQCKVPQTQTSVAIDPGELDSILLNLITNSIYWLGEVGRQDRAIEFRIAPIKNEPRVQVWVHDTGPGLYKGYKDNVERVFWPGVTRKPSGIGMGLTVASELVAEYGGKMVTECPGKKGGASFAFDLPLKV